MGMYNALRKNDILERKINEAAARLAEQGFSYDDAAARIVRALPLSHARHLNRAETGIDVII